MKNVILILSSVIMLSIGCTPKYYVPTTPNVPLLENKGEIQVTGTISERSHNLNTAYAVNDNLGIQFNANRFDNNDDTNGGSGNQIELGVGRNFSLNNSRFKYEIYGLLGGGSLENHFAQSAEFIGTRNGSLTANYTKLSLQNSFGYRTKYFTAAITSSLIKLNYHNIDGNLVHNGVDQVSYLNSHKSHYMFEQGLTLRGGFEKVQLQLQAIVNSNLEYQNFKQEKIALSIGLFYNPSL